MQQCIVACLFLMKQFTQSHGAFIFSKDNKSGALSVVKSLYFYYSFFLIRNVVLALSGGSFHDKLWPSYDFWLCSGKTFLSPFIFSFPTLLE